jgi:hypothetical protein
VFEYELDVRLDQLRLHLGDQRASRALVQIRRHALVLDANARNAVAQVGDGRGGG